jgi:hypothetical protein
MLMLLLPFLLPCSDCRAYAASRQAAGLLQHHLATVALTAAIPCRERQQAETKHREQVEALTARLAELDSDNRKLREAKYQLDTQVGAAGLRARLPRMDCIVCCMMLGQGAWVCLQPGPWPRHGVRQYVQCRSLAVCPWQPLMPPRPHYSQACLHHPCPKC